MYTQFNFPTRERAFLEWKLSLYTQFKFLTPVFRSWNWAGGKTQEGAISASMLLALTDCFHCLGWKIYFCISLQRTPICLAEKSWRSNSYIFQQFTIGRGSGCGDVFSTVVCFKCQKVAISLEMWSRGGWKSKWGTECFLPWGQQIFIQGQVVHPAANTGLSPPSLKLPHQWAGACRISWLASRVSPGQPHI